jgi:DNA-binding Lrp family transcriptional regulator
MKIKEKDIEIIKCLRSNSRIQLKDISRKTSLPLTTVFERMKKVGSLVKRYYSVLDYQSLKHPINIFYLVRMENNRILLSSKINNIYRTNIRSTYLIEAYFMNMMQASEFCDEVCSMNGRILSEYPILGEIKREGFLCRMR